MASRIVVPNMKKIYTTDVGTFPVIGCITIAIGWCAFMGGRALFASPDVTIDRKERGTIFKSSREQKALAWTSSHQKYKTDVSAIRIL